MDELISESYKNFNVVPAIAPLEMLVALVVSTILCIFLAKIYQITHSGYSYSKSFVHTIILVGITITLIMIIIGSNIARAFALVGAMSIIRFRNPVKDSRDVAFLFMAMAIGMAAGTKFYLLAGIFAVFTGSLILLLHFSNFGEINHNTYIFKIRLDSQSRGDISKVCELHCRRMSLVSIDRLATNESVEDIVYEVELRHRKNYDTLFKSLSEIPGIENVSLLVGESTINA